MNRCWSREPSLNFMETLPQSTIVEVSSPLWACAEIVAKARQESNHGIRRALHDRGPRGNFIADLTGSFGELFVYLEALKSGWTETVQYIRHNMFDPSGGRGMKNPDAILPDGSRIDVKTFDCQTKKEFFAINTVSHRRLRGHLDFYYGLFLPLYSRKILAANLIPYGDLKMWPITTLGGYGDPAYVLKLAPFKERYAPTITEFDATDRYTAEEIRVQRPGAIETMPKNFPTLVNYI